MEKQAIISQVLYEDPEDGVPKIHVRCDNYLAWIQEQKMPLHLHVQKDKKISFDQVREKSKTWEIAIICLKCWFFILEHLDLFFQKISFFSF